MTKIFAHKLLLTHIYPITGYGHFSPFPTVVPFPTHRIFSKMDKKILWSFYSLHLPAKFQLRPVKGCEMAAIIRKNRKGKRVATRLKIEFYAPKSIQNTTFWNIQKN